MLNEATPQGEKLYIWTNDKPFHLLCYSRIIFCVKFIDSSDSFLQQFSKHHFHIPIAHKAICAGIRRAN